MVAKTPKKRSNFEGSGTSNTLEPVSSLCASCFRRESRRSTFHTAGSMVSRSPASQDRTAVPYTLLPMQCPTLRGPNCLRHLSWRESAPPARDDLKEWLRTPMDWTPMDLVDNGHIVYQHTTHNPILQCQENKTFFHQQISEHVPPLHNVSSTK